MSKFSVKKPFTILVMVVVMLILGFVSLAKMQMDLLPEMTLPYLLVITTYPGASPERVETTISQPLESELGTINGVKNIYSFSYENYSLIELEFEDDTNMDSVMVKVSSGLDKVTGDFPDEVGTPNIMELSMDMLATQYLAIGYEGMSMEELSRFVETYVKPQLERQNGVASVSAMGLIEQSVQVELKQDKVDKINDKVLAKVDSAFADALEQMDEAQQALIDGQKELDDSKKQLEDGLKKLNDAQKELESGKAQLTEKEAETYAKLAQGSYLLDQYAAYQAEINTLKLAIEAVKKKLAEDEAKIPADATEKLAALQAEVARLQEIAAALRAGTGELTPEELAVMNGLSDQVPIPDTLTREEAIFIVESLIGVKSAEMAVLQSQIDAVNSDKSQISNLLKQLEQIEGMLAGLDAQFAAIGTSYEELEKAKLQAAVGFATAEIQISSGQAQLDASKAQIESGKEAMKTAQEQIDSGWEQYNEGKKEFEKTREDAIKKANVNQLLSLSTLSALIYAQDFSMPAGYIDDQEDNSWMLKVGEHFSSLDELAGMVLCHIDDVGDVTLGDVADLTIIDNTDTTFTRLNGEAAVILSVFKASTSGTNEVSKTCKAEIQNLLEKYDGLSIMIMMDQGDFISLIVNSVVQSMVLGAILAVVVLAIFLRDFMPTLVVAISIPLSVLAALIAMYFSGISLNMMSLSGMALGIGMLVDNSIVVIENIYRLRGRGVGAPRAAVQGTKQVAGAITASTLTTVCVFFPMIYTTGYVRQLMLPMSLTIIYCLLASLLIAMTVVPAAGSTLLRNTKPKEHHFFDRVQEVYGKSLYFCLKFKFIPLLVANALLILCIWQIIRMGIVMIPDMTSNQIQGAVSFEDDVKREDAYQLMDEAIFRISQIDGVDNVGVMTGSSTALISTSSSAESDYLNYSLMLTTEDENAGADVVHGIVDQMEAIAQDLGIEMTVSTGMAEMSNFMGSGLSISISGPDMDQLLKVSQDVMDIVGQVEGYTDISNGQEDADQTLHLVIDRNESMKMGLTVAQIYQEIAMGMRTSASALTVKIDGIDMELEVVNELNPLTKENILDHVFEVNTTDEDGKSIVEEHKLSEFAKLVTEDGFNSISRKNQTRYITVSAGVEDGYNTTLLTRQLKPLLEAYNPPEGYLVDLGGEYETVMEMVGQMVLVLLLALAFIYLVMVAQFQSLLSPFIVLFTIPLAFTGGLMALWFTGENLSIISLMGFLVLMGTVVNNGIVFVDYTNQLRLGGLERWDALVATGKTRMRPILMTAMTTILAEFNLILGDDMGSQMGKGMALVIVGGLAYATLMTLYIIPVMYDILFKKKPLLVDVGSENLDDVPDDAADYMASMQNGRTSSSEGQSGEEQTEVEAYTELQTSAQTQELAQTQEPAQASVQEEMQTQTQSTTNTTSGDSVLPETNIPQ